MKFTPQRGCVICDTSVGSRTARCLWLSVLWTGLAPGVSGAVSLGDADWPVYNANSDGNHFSELDQVNTGNVRKLEVAWVYDTEDAFGVGSSASEFQANPIIVGGTLYTITPRMRVIALDGAAGTLRWSFDPNVGRRLDVKRKSRGVAYWAGGGEQRIVFGAGHYLYSINALTGTLDPAFGQSGRIDLREGLGRDPQTQSVFLSSPPTIFEDMVIVGGVVSETLPSSPGAIRAFDARTGTVRWIFRTIPEPGEYGYETWPRDAYQRTGGVNNWAGMVVDKDRSLLFVPTGSAAYDFNGSDRLGDNLFANSLVALDARTGKRRWHFQMVRHDLWDRDLPAPPTLVTVLRGGKLVDAVAQTTKSGHVFLFTRDDGAPLFPIKEYKAPPSDVPGEIAALSQPLPERPAPFARQHFTKDALTQRTPEAHARVAADLALLRSRGPFDPPSTQGTIILPGLDGGAEWGGASFDPTSQLLYVNANEMAWKLRLVRQPASSGRPATRASLYQAECASCHGRRRAGSPPTVPSLVNLGEHLTKFDTLLIVLNGTGRMPAFGRLGLAGADALAEYLVSGKDAPLDEAVRDASDSGSKAPRLMLDGYSKFLDPQGYPAIAPPWGTLTAINLATGEQAWQVPLGEYPELSRGGQPTGSENYGGSVVTAGGLLFIAATVYDSKFRAFDKSTGSLLWETKLPASGHATPATYSVGGRQFIVIAAGGGKHPTARSGSCIIAFALPDAAFGPRTESLARAPTILADGHSCLAAPRPSDR